MPGSTARMVSNYEFVSRAWTGTYLTVQRAIDLSMGPGPEPGERALAIGRGAIFGFVVPG